jgi:hypothetical protein
MNFRTKREADKAADQMSDAGILAVEITKVRPGERRSKNPGRPPKRWMDRCMSGVGPGYDAGAVCGSQWHHKMSPAARGRAMRKYERNYPRHQVLIEVTPENYFDVADGLYWFCMDWHSGQSSDLYRIGSTMGFKPAPSATGPDGNTARQVYGELQQLADLNYMDAVEEAARLDGLIKRQYVMARNGG